MKNIANSTTQVIKKNSELLYNSLASSISWVDDHLKYEEREHTLRMLKESKAQTRKLSRSIESKPVFALFGVSQVGKSYLVKNVLSVDGNPLEIICGKEVLDFILDVNPVGGGAESTGVVSRFTIDESGYSDQYPIKIKLFSVKDLIIVLADSYFSDLTRMDEYWSSEEFREHIENLKKEYGTGKKAHEIITEDDIWDIKEYFRNNFNKFSHFVNVIDHSDYWNEVGTLISKIPAEKIIDIFSPIWNKQEHLSKIFVCLQGALSKLNHNSVVFAPKEAILREKGKILDVQRLDGIFDSKDSIEVVDADGESMNIELSHLSALTLELSLQVSKELSQEKAFLENTDLLDFPGARGRLELSVENINDESVIKMFLRGKISYLFNKYSSDFEISNLLFCMKDEQIEVNELSGILNEWINRNVGETKAAREKTIGELGTSPLFIILTFYNKQLKYDSGNDDQINNLENRWNNRFNRFFRDQITAKFNWDENWTESKSNFDNFYFLRDFKYSDDTFDGFESTGAETEIRPERQKHWEHLKTSFVNFSFVKKHFRDPELTWEETSTPGKDGSGLIIQELSPAANNFIKLKNYTQKLVGITNSLSNVLRKHHVSDNLKEKRDKAFQEGNRIQLGLLRLFNSRELNLSDFFKVMMLKDTVVFEYIHNNFSKVSSTVDSDQYAAFRSMFPGVSSEKSKKDNLIIIGDFLGINSTGEVESYLESQGLQIDKIIEDKTETSATLLVDGILDIWSNQMDVNSFDKFMKIGLGKDLIDLIVQNLMLTFEVLKVRETLIEIYEEKTRKLNPEEECEEYLASISCSYLNDFVCNFGFNFMAGDRKNELFELCEDYKIDYKFIDNQEFLQSNKNNLITDIFDKGRLSMHNRENSEPIFESYNAFVVKMKLALLSNCGFANYDINANNTLDEIIEDVDALTFNL